MCDRAADRKPTLIERVEIARDADAPQPGHVPATIIGLIGDESIVSQEIAHVRCLVWHM